MLGYFDDLEDHVESTLNDLNKILPDANSELMDSITDFYYKLDKSSDGNIQASVGNLNQINAFKSNVNNILDNGSYGDAVKGYMNGYVNSTSYINSYFGSIVQGFKANDALYKEILQSNVSTTVKSLLGSGIDANFTDPIIDILKKNVTSGSDKKDFINSLAANLDDKTGLLSRYVPQVASDSIMQFNRNYMGVIGSDLGLNHWYYRGTKKADSRPFCVRASGKYFTDAQLKSYVQQQMTLNHGKGWAGMVKGENWSNFCTYCGGYNCGHHAIPVSKEIYDASSSKWSG